MKILKPSINLLFCLVLSSDLQAVAANSAPVLLANPLQGTDSRDGFSHGNTYPEIALPLAVGAFRPPAPRCRGAIFTAAAIPGR